MCEERLDGRNVVAVRRQKHQRDLQLPEGVDGSVASMPGGVVQKHHAVLSPTWPILVQLLAEMTQVHGDDIRVGMHLRVAGVEVADGVKGHDQNYSRLSLPLGQAVAGSSDGPFAVTLVEAVDPAFVEVDEDLVLRLHEEESLAPCLPCCYVLVGVLLGGDDGDPPVAHVEFLTHHLRHLLYGSFHCAFFTCSINYLLPAHDGFVIVQMALDQLLDGLLILLELLSFLQLVLGVVAHQAHFLGVAFGVVKLRPPLRVVLQLQTLPNRPLPLHHACIPGCGGLVGGLGFLQKVLPHLGELHIKRKHLLLTQPELLLLRLCILLLPLLAVPVGVQLRQVFALVPLVVQGLFLLEVFLDVEGFSTLWTTRYDLHDARPLVGQPQA